MIHFWLLCLSLVTVLFICNSTMSPARADFAQQLSDIPVKRDEAYLAGVSQLISSPDSGSLTLRGGGSSGKPIGVHTIGMQNIDFKSDYKDVDPKLQAEFAVDLHTFINTRGGGIVNWRNYAKDKIDQFVAPTQEQKDAQKADPTDLVGRSYVPFKYQEEFARSWWTRYSEKFKKMGFAWKGGFLYDAILDANNLTLRYDQLTIGSADSDSLTRAFMEKLIQKK